MKKFLMVPVLLASLTMLAACGGGGGGGGGPGPDVNPVPAKILWYQEAPLDAVAPNIPVVVDDADKKVTTSKALSGPPAQEEVKKEKAMGFFVSNLDGTGIARLTPTKDTAVALNNAIAPNGDFFYFTPAGIWISNFKVAAPKLLISSRNLFTKFDESAEMLLAWDESNVHASILDAVKAHSPLSNSQFYIIPVGGEGSDYVAVLILPITYTKKDSVDTKTSLLSLRYDSKSGTFGYIIPFLSSLKNNDKYGEGNIYDYYKSNIMGWFNDYQIPLDGDAMKNKNLSLTDLIYNAEANRFTYKVKVTVYDPQQTIYTNVSYDPVTGKHTVINKTVTVPGDTTVAPNSVSLINQRLIQDAPKIQFTKDQCFTPYTSKVSDGIDIGATEAAKTTAACMQALLTGKTISIKKAGELDITASVAKKEDLVNAIIAATLPESPVLASIDMGLVKQFPPKFDLSYGIDQNADIICTDYDGATKCLPKVFNSCSDKEKCYETYVLDSYYNKLNLKDNLLTFVGKIKKGDDLFSAINAIDLATGKVTAVDKSDETTTIGDISLTPTSAGSIFVYPKTSEPASFKAWYIYDPALGVPKELTKFLPSGMNVNAENFACGDGKSCTGISYDKKYAFINFKDEMDKVQTYAKDLTSLYPVVENEEKGSKGAAKSVAKNEPSVETAPIPAPQAGNILGEGWIKVSPDVEHKGISYNLAAYDGFQAIWSGNKEGFKYLYWNEPFKDLTPKRIDPQGYNSDQMIMSLATGFGLTGSTVLVAPADLNAGYACGASSDPNATWCEDPTMVCVAGVCKDMYSCSVDVPNGWCGEGTCQLAEDKYQCVTQPVCADTCAGKVCGLNLCGVSCGTCPAGEQCQGNMCVASCTPNCDGKTCGSDGCGGSCGSCGAGKICTNNQCVDQVITCTTHANCTNGICNFAANPDACTTSEGLYAWKKTVTAYGSCPANFVGASSSIDISWIFGALPQGTSVISYQVKLCRTDNTNCSTNNTLAGTVKTLLATLNICWQNTDTVKLSDRKITVTRNLSNQTSSSINKTIILKHGEIGSPIN